MNCKFPHHQALSRTRVRLLISLGEQTSGAHSPTHATDAAGPPWVSSSLFAIQSSPGILSLIKPGGGGGSAHIQIK